MSRSLKAGWQDLAAEVDLDPQWRSTPLGFLCARSLVRDGQPYQYLRNDGTGRFPRAAQHSRQLPDSQHIENQ